MKTTRRTFHDFLVFLCVALFDINPYDYIERRRTSRRLRSDRPSKAPLRSAEQGVVDKANPLRQYQLGNKEREIHLHYDGDSRAG